MNWPKIPPTIWLETEEESERVMQSLIDNKIKRLAFDTETSGLKLFQDYPILFSISDGKQRYAGLAEFMKLPNFRYILENEEIAKLGSNIKFDLHMCANRGIKINGPIFDTLVMDFLLDENRKGRHGLKEVARDYCNIPMREFKDVFPMHRKRKGIPDDTPGDAIRRKMSTPEGKRDAIQYAGLDAFATYAVADYLEERLSSIMIFEGYSLWDYFVRIEAPFTKVLWNMERRGFTICAGYFHDIKVPMEKSLIEIEARFNQKVGRQINLNSPIQLRELFYNELGKTPTRWTTGGASGNKQPATDVEILEEWADEGDPYATMVLEHRKLSKILDTYVIGLQNHVDNNFRIHSSLNQAVAVTGRLSSTGPNLQNISRNATSKFSIREGFIAAPGKTLIVADYAQLELVILAHKSQDPVMIDSIIGGLDLHCKAVSMIFNHRYDDVIEAKNLEKKGKPLSQQQKQFLELRQAMKNVGYGIVYGIGPPKLAHDLTLEFQKSDPNRIVTEREAQNYMDAWFGLFKGVKRFIEGQRAYVKEKGFVQTFLGRYRRLLEIYSSRFGDRLKAERQAVNIVQGDASDILRVAMLVLEYEEYLKKVECEMLLQVHDELIFEVQDDDEIVDNCIKVIKYQMENSFSENIFKLLVPLTVSINKGITWSSAK